MGLAPHKVQKIHDQRMMNCLPLLATSSLCCLLQPIRRQEDPWILSTALPQPMKMSPSGNIPALHLVWMMAWSLWSHLLPPPVRIQWVCYPWSVKATGSEPTNKKVAEIWRLVKILGFRTFLSLFHHLFFVHILLFCWIVNLLILWQIVSHSSILLRITVQTDTQVITPSKTPIPFRLLSVYQSFSLLSITDLLKHDWSANFPGSHLSKLPQQFSLLFC